MKKRWKERRKKKNGYLQPKGMIGFKAQQVVIFDMELACKWYLKI